jgi:YVTN family beta-propeller protein
MRRPLFRVTAVSIACLGLFVANSASAALASPSNPIAQVDVGGGSFTGLVSADGDTLFIPVDVRKSDNESIEGHVAFIDADSNTVQAKVNVGVGPVRIAPDARGGRIYVTNALSGTVSVINVTNQRATATIDVGGEPTYAAFVPGRSRLLVGTGSTGQVAVVDTRSNSVTDRIDLGGDVNTLVLSNDGRFAYATNTTANRLDVINTQSLRVVAQVPTGLGPNRVVSSPNGRLLLVSNYDADTVTVIDGRSFEVIREISVGSNPLPAVIAPNGAWAWVASAATDSALKIDLKGIRSSANPVTRRSATGEEPWMLLLNATGTTLYVANRQSPNVSVVCTKNGRTRAPLVTTNPNRWLTAGKAIYTGGAATTVDVFAAARLSSQRCP